MIGYPCNNCHCINWDSDQNGGHCMLAEPHTHLNHYTGYRYCDDYHADPKDRRIKKIKNKKPRG